MSTSGAASYTQSRHTGVVDGQNYSRGPQYSFFAPKGSGTMSPFVSDWFTYDASPAGAMGASSKFAIPNNAFTYASHLVLSWSFDATVESNPNGAFYDDFMAMACVELATLQYGSNPICSISGEQMHAIPWRRWLEEKRTDLGPEIADSTLEADMIAGYTFFLEIPMTFFNESNPLPMVMGNDLVLTIKWRASTEVIHGIARRTLPSVPPTLNFVAGSQKIYVRGVHVPEDEQVALQNLANSNAGIIKRMNQISTIEQDFVVAGPVTDVEWKVDLKQFSLPHSQLTFVIRDVADLDNPNDVYRFNYQGGVLNAGTNEVLVNSYGVVDASGVLQAQVPHALYKFQHHTRQTSSHGASTAFDVLAAIDPQNDQTFSGSSNTAQSNSPYLTIRVDVAAAGTYRVSVHAELLNFTQFKKGQFRTIHLQ